MATESDAPGDARPAPRPGTRPFVGGYYWLPTPSLDAELWPRLMVPLATAWGKDARTLRRRLALCYTGLPRGRLSRHSGTFFVFQGDDSPVQIWKELVVERFRLSGRKVKFVFDEHETMIPGYPRAVENALGARLYGIGG